MQTDELKNEYESTFTDENRVEEKIPIIKLNGFELSATNIDKKSLIEKLENWKHKLVTVGIALIAAALLSNVPFGEMGKSLITRGQEWIQSIQVEIEANKQLKEEQIEQKKAEKEAEKAKEEENEVVKEVEKEIERSTEEIYEDMGFTYTSFLLTVLMLAGGMTALFGVVRIISAISNYDSEGLFRGVISLMFGLIMFSSKVIYHMFIQ